MFMGLSDQITVNLSLTSLLAVLAIVAVVLVSIFVYIYRLNRRVKLLTPKFGFAGKNIIAVILIAFLAGAAPLLTLVSLKSTEIRRQAREIQDIVVSTQILEKVDDKIIVGFGAVPLENGIAWEKDSYNIMWEVRGPTSFTFLEQEVNKIKPSYFTRSLSSGQYEIYVRMTGEAFSVEKTEIRVFE